MGDREKSALGVPIGDLRVVPAEVGNQGKLLLFYDVNGTFAFFPPKGEKVYPDLSDDIKWPTLLTFDSMRDKNFASKFKQVQPDSIDLSSAGLKDIAGCAWGFLELHIKVIIIYCRLLYCNQRCPGRVRRKLFCDALIAPFLQKRRAGALRPAERF